MQEIKGKERKKGIKSGLYDDIDDDKWWYMTFTFLLFGVGIMIDAYDGEIERGIGRGEGYITSCR
jgi:hypothetical protein